MAHQYRFYVEDVTCEKCDARVRQALLALPGAQQVDLVRTPRNEASVVLTTTDVLPSNLIESTISQQSAGTTHDYRVRWNDPAV